MYFDNWKASLCILHYDTHYYLFCPPVYEAFIRYCLGMGFGNRASVDHHHAQWFTFVSNEEIRFTLLHDSHWEEEQFFRSKSSPLVRTLLIDACHSTLEET